MRVELHAIILSIRTPAFDHRIHAQIIIAFQKKNFLIDQIKINEYELTNGGVAPPAAAA